MRDEFEFVVRARSFGAESLAEFLDDEFWKRLCLQIDETTYSLLSFPLSFLFSLQNCRENTIGAYCNVCADSFYGHPEFGGCKPCPCPQADKRFSSTCVIRAANEPICHCKAGKRLGRHFGCSILYNSSKIRDSGLGLFDFSRGEIRSILLRP